MKAIAMLGVALLSASARAESTGTGAAANPLVVEGDMWGVFDGRDAEQPFQLAGDRLTLGPRWESGGRHWVGIRVFERVRPEGGA